MKSPRRGNGEGLAFSRHTVEQDPTENPSKSQRAKPTRQVRWQQKNPKARWAHMALASALKRGLIQRKPCEVCGEERVDGHHPDYDRPMVVVWLCRRHHQAEHRKAAANG